MNIKSKIFTDYFREYDKLQDTNINDEQIVQISLDHCFRQAQKVIPKFKEVNNCVILIEIRKPAYIRLKIRLLFLHYKTTENS